MIDGSRDAVAFSDGMDRETFLADLRTQRAAVMSLMIVGGAAARILADYPTFAEAHPDIPWRSIRGMRNRIAHGYFDADLTVVWRTIEAELPGPVERLEAVQNRRDQVGWPCSRDRSNPYTPSRERGLASISGIMTAQEPFLPC